MLKVRTKFRRVGNIHIEMNRELTDPFVCNPIQQRPVLYAV
jgi:hypothetical protein